MEVYIRDDNTCRLCGKKIDRSTPRIFYMKNVVCDDCVCNLEIMSAAVGNDGHIAEAITENHSGAVVRRKRRVDRALRPSEIKRQLDEYVIGQDKAKTILSVAVYNHYKRINNRDKNIEKSNILILGPSGSGKTYLAKSIAKIIDVPIAIADATSLTQAGYVGKDVESVLAELIAVSDGNIDRAETGIVFIDEIDKLSMRQSTRENSEVGTKAVQQALLKIIEGTVCEVPLSKDGGLGGPKTQRLSTENILFIVGGAFPELEDMIRAKHEVHTSIGFGATIEGTNDEISDPFMEVMPEDLKAFGMIPEFLGRLPVLCPMQSLTEDFLVRILTEPKNSIIKQFQDMFDLDGIQLEFTKEALTEIAKKALERKTGARSLRAILEESLLDVMFTAPDKENCKMIITDKCITEGEAPIIKSLGDNFFAAG